MAVPSVVSSLCFPGASMDSRSAFDIAQMLQLHLIPVTWCFGTQMQPCIVHLSQGGMKKLSNETLEYFTVF